MAAPLAYALFGAIGTAAVAAIGLALGTQPRNWISFAGLGLLIIGSASCRWAPMTAGAGRRSATGTNQSPCVVRKVPVTICPM